MFCQLNSILFSQIVYFCNNFTQLWVWRYFTQNMFWVSKTRFSAEYFLNMSNFIFYSKQGVHLAHLSWVTIVLIFIIIYSSMINEYFTKNKELLRLKINQYFEFIVGTHCFYSARCQVPLSWQRTTSSFEQWHYPIPQQRHDHPHMRRAAT